MKTITQSMKMSGQLLVAFALILSYSSTATAQNEGHGSGGSKNSFYFGYEISINVQYHRLESTIPQLQNLQVNKQGGAFGIKIGNKYAALRAHAGLAYSGASVKYSINMMEGGVSSNIYLLRIKNGTPHTFEPYALMSVVYQRAKFFGTYLKDDQTNKSMSEGPELGVLSWCNAGAGAGVEFQLHNETLQFLHFFAEAKYGIPFLYNSSIDEFSQTRVKTPMTFSIGVSFGKFRRV